MRPSSRPSRMPAKLADSVHHLLNLYALGATAAGVGALAFAEPTEAKIIYTPTYVHISGNMTYALHLAGEPGFLILASGYVSTHAHGWSQLLAQGEGHNGVEGRGGDASALYAGALIGPKQPFSGGILETCQWADLPVCNENWYWYGRAHYLGLKFFVHGKPHYAWAHMTVRDPMNAWLTGYAYETIPEKAIIAGKKKEGETVWTRSAAIAVRPRGSLYRLARGSAGIATRRQKESAGNR